MKNLLVMIIAVPLIAIVVVSVLGFLGVAAFRLQVAPPKTITIVGMAKQDQANQVAQFSATVSSSGDSKEAVNTDMQAKVDGLVQAAVGFGVAENNIKTEYFNIYQEEMTDYEGGTLELRRGPWRGNTTVVFSNVAADNATAFADVLVNSGATNIYGPNFSVDDLTAVETELSIKAMADARKKATEVASSQGLAIGAVLNISESGVGSPIYPMAMGMGGGAAEASFNPGTQEVSKSVTVTFELR